ncbi:MAG: pyridoxal phosphate-dependent aminotransferase [Ruminococcus bromii]|nr:pyridoxal phosphate-dependent aminotransferase [Ruminococcus bromii]
MEHDFETLVSRRNCGSGKWEMMLKCNPDIAEGIAPLSVADMELKNPPEIIEGLKDYLDTHILGYTSPTDAYYEAVCGWMKRRHNWEVKPEEIIVTAGVVTALFTAVLAYTEPGDGVITMPPVYGPFGFSIKQNDRVNVECPLINDNEKYTIDFEQFEALCAKDENKMFILCSPHNPAGRIWTKAELSKIGEICAKHHVFVVSDEIHFDLIMPGHEHIVFPNACENGCPEYIVCTAPSKTFNLATLQTSNIVIPDKENRKKFQSVLDTIHINAAAALGLEACRLGYTECEAWLEEVIDLIWNNFRFCAKFIDENCPGITYSPLEGTYLMWINCETLGLDDDKLHELLHKHDIYCNDGRFFSAGGERHIRINLAGPTAMIEKAMHRFKEACMEAHNG